MNYVLIVEMSRKQKKVNEEMQAGPSGIPGPVERRQIQLRALLAEKQRELETLLNKEVGTSLSSFHNIWCVIHQGFLDRLILE